MKYNKGDKVKIREWDDMLNEFGIENGEEIPVSINTDFTIDMKMLCGKEAIIEDVIPGDKEYIYLLRPIDFKDVTLDWEWDFVDGMFER